MVVLVAHDLFHVVNSVEGHVVVQQIECQSAQIVLTKEDLLFADSALVLRVRHTPPIEDSRAILSEVCHSVEE